MNKEILNQIQNLNIAEIKDAGKLQELASISEKLINSSNAQERFLALKIKNRLEENTHYQTLLKADLIQKEEVKATAEKQFEKVCQAHRETASTANLQTKRQEKRQEEAKESKAQEAFNKLTEQQQQTIIKLEYLYLPELREQVREFMLDDSKATAENWANIINSQLKGNFVRVEADKDGNKFTTMADNTPTDKAKEIASLSQEGFKTSVESGKTAQAVEQANAVDAANVQVASNQMDKSEQDREETARWARQIKADISDEQIKIGQAATNLYNEVFKEHINNLKKLEGMSDTEKEKKLAQYEDNLAKNIEKFFNTHKVDLSNPDAQKDFINSLFSRADVDFMNGEISAEQLKQVLVKNCKLDPNVVNEVIDERVEAIKIAEEFADEIDTPTPKKEVEAIKATEESADKIDTPAPKKEYESPLNSMNYYNKGESGPIPNAPTFEKDVEPKIKKTYEEEKEKEKELAHTNTNQNKATAATTAATVAIVIDNNK